MGIVPRRKLLFLAIAVSAVAGITALATVVGRSAGENAAAGAQQRLQLVWPSIMTMPTEERALLVGLALTCHVEQRPAIAGDVVECLRDALDDQNVILPKGVDRNSARAKFDQLLRQGNA